MTTEEYNKKVNDAIKGIELTTEDAIAILGYMLIIKGTQLVIDGEATALNLPTRREFVALMMARETLEKEISK